MPAGRLLERAQLHRGARAEEPEDKHWTATVVGAD